VDLAFVVIAAVAGWAGASPLLAAGLFGAAVIAWGWTRRTALAAMPLRRRIINIAVALVMLLAVLGLFYWIGLMLGGHS